jgi:ABC-type oligopeptide transport system ATPase subunit
VSELVLQVEDLVKEFPIRHMFRPSETVVAVNHVTFEVHRGSAVGLVGESGSGKSTTARCIIRLLDPTSGRVLFNGEDVAHVSGATLKQLRRRMQIVFQDPFSSLNPRMRVEGIISEGIRIHHLAATDRERRDRVVELLNLVGLEAAHLRRKPSSFSGGQLQRIGIARALAVNPQLLICDEPVSSLDVSIQAQILNLFRSLQIKLNLTMLFIAHDLATVRHLCDYIVVMQEGKVVEQGPREQIYAAPRHPYTRDLMAAVPVPDPDLERERRKARKVLAAELAAEQAAATADQAASSA